ncbi:MAG: hypothetical protein ABSF64_29490 [Bryobacteraceae bacterium]|jgi:hypothetical protein
MDTDNNHGWIVRCFIGVYRRSSAAISLYRLADAARELDIFAWDRQTLVFVEGRETTDEHR